MLKFYIMHGRQQRFLFIVILFFFVAKNSGARETTQEEFFALTDPNKRPVVAFLEVRNLADSPAGLPLHLTSDHNSPIVGFLPPGSILRLDMNMTSYSAREKDMAQDQGRWRQLPIFKGNQLVQHLYFYDHWSRIRFAYDFDWKLPLKPTHPVSTDPIEFYSRPENVRYHGDCSSLNTYCIPSNEVPSGLAILETRLIITDDAKGPRLYYQIELPYTFKEGERQTTGAWISAKRVAREHSYTQIMQNACVALSDLYYDKNSFKQVLLDLHILERDKKITQRVDVSMLSLIGGEGNRQKFKRWIKTKEVKLGDTDADITLIREVVDIRTELGGSLGYEMIDIVHSTDLSDISYSATGINFNLFAYVPIYFDMDLVIKAGLTAPNDQTYTDEIKKQELEIEDVYQVRAEQQFLYHFPTPNPTLSYDLGFGLSYKSMISSGLTFGYDAVVGAALTGAINVSRWTLRGRFEPIANQFRVNGESYELSVDLGYRLIDNEFAKDWIIFVKYSSGRLIEDDSDLQSNYIISGLSLGF